MGSSSSVCVGLSDVMAVQAWPTLVLCTSYLATKCWLVEAWWQMMNI